MTDHKSIYRISTLAELPLFMQAGWLDAVCGPDGWGCSLGHDKEGYIRAALVYQKTKLKGVFSALITPSLSAFGGIWFDEKFIKTSNNPSNLKRQLMSEIIQQLPEAQYIELKWKHGLLDWIPFYQKGFRQTTYFTHLLHDIKDFEKIEQGFNRNTRRQLQKAVPSITVTTSDDMSLLYKNSQLTFDKQGLKVPFDIAQLQRIDALLRPKEQCCLLVAKDGQGNIHATLYIVWDGQAAYSILGGHDPDFTASGASTLLYVEAIRVASKVVDVFDFEGSMLSGVEQLFRALGAQQTPYNLLYRHSNRWVEVLFRLLRK